MQRMEPILVADLRPGVECAGLMLVASATVRASRTGADFLDLELRDRAGAAIRGYQFELDNSPRPVCGDVVAIRGTTREQRGLLSIKIADVKKSPDADVTQFLPRSRSDPQQMRRSLLGFMDDVAHPQLSLLLKACFAEPFVDQFCQAPASVLYHQAVIGGLLEHTVTVARLCLGIIQMYPALDKDLLLAGALLHDIGKVEEMTIPPAIGHTSGGKALGHIVLGLLLVSKQAEDLPDLSADLREKLYHLIVSHHGSKEFGSPVVPNSLEAVALYHADLMDCKLAGFLDVVQRTKPGDSWTSWSKMFQSELRVPDDPDRLAGR